MSLHEISKMEKLGFMKNQGFVVGYSIEVCNSKLRSYEVQWMCIDVELRNGIDKLVVFHMLEFWTAWVQSTQIVIS